MTEDYLRLADDLAALPGDAWLAVDLTHLGLDVDPDGCADRLAAIAQALPPGRRIQIGAEDHARAEAVLTCVLDVAGRGMADRLGATAQAANRPKEPPVPAPPADLADHAPDEPAEAAAEATGAEPPGTAEDARPPEAEEAPPQAASASSVAAHFAEDMIRWAKLPPDLHDLDLSPYLHLAASFRGDLLVSAELPQHLRDLAAQLASTRTVDRRQLTDESLRALTTDDVDQLLRHLGLRARDRVQEQRGAVAGIVRLAAAHVAVQPAALDTFRRLPATDLQPGTAVILAGVEIPGMQDVINALAAQLPDGNIKKALTTPPPKGGKR
ncbi:hypothetical protein IU447_06925 [Nocardia farcinica]|uniref:hypothetical protein n=2 Tax=Nocardia farcinica TaxID=37329 RepID=UPI0018933E35|nr:hypothetical protein [Nocardia farcinica]MBF6359845.1 hypothetical protein [Nocardia farcinica]